jgi:CRP-like cAMP-binding protein
VLTIRCGPVQSKQLQWLTFFLAYAYRNYLATWFLVDAVGTFPFERLLSGDVASSKSLKLTKYFKIPKLLRISRLMKYVRSHKYVYDFSKVLVLIFTMLHVGACVWVLVLDPCDEDVSNYAGDAICAQESTYRLYAEALHLSATMLLGVSNSHIVEKSELLDLDFKARKEDATKLYLTSTVFMVVGLFLIALLISEANVYVMGKMQGSAAFQSKTDRVNYEMEYYGVPPDLQVQVRAFYDYVWIHQRQYDDKIALLSDQQMSTDLQRKLALHLFKDVVSHISFFSELDDLLLGEICMSLRTRIFLPQDMIILKGDVGKELFIIAKGVVEVLRDDLEPRLRHNAPQILLRNGSFFGEIALVMEVRRTCSVQAKTVCEVNVLQQAAFDSVLRANPHFARRMNELVVARQLDSSLVRSHVKGLDFQVSQSDLDRAVAAMEKNMKEGLERRQMIRSPSSNAIPEMKNTVKFSPSVRGSFDDSMVGRTKRRHPGYQQTDEESQIELSIRPATAGAAPLSDVISDITRRSTRFADEELLKKIHRADRPNSSGVKVEPDSLPDFVDSYSDTEVESSKDRPKDYVRRGSIIDMSTVKVLKPDADVDRALHMPDVFDIRKVRPVILNSHLESSDHNNSDVRSLNARISYQGKMMQQLLSKLDQLETRTKAAIRKGSVDENVK